MLLHGEAKALVIRASSDTLSPRHARHPINGMKRQTMYIIIIDICSWRSRAAGLENRTIIEPDWRPGSSGNFCLGDVFDQL